MGQNPWLYAEIQINNEENKFVQETFIDVAQKFNQYFFQDNKPEKFVEIVEKGKRFF
jgi:prephenate dehydrogenase